MLKKIPKPTTDLEVRDNTKVSIISYNQGLCKAITLNETGYSVWLLLDGKRNISEIINEFYINNKNIDFQEISKDITSFMVELQNNGFVNLLDE